MTSQSVSQTTLTKDDRVKVIVIEGDTLIQFKISDAKIILVDVLEKEKLETLVKDYEISDSIKNKSIAIQQSTIKDLEEKSLKQLMVIDNQNDITTNKNEEIIILNDSIKSQKKEIRKQKTLKIIGFTAAVVFPIVVLIIK